MIHLSIFCNQNPIENDDVIDSSKGTAGTPTVYTDGKWIWPGDLAYYVKNYHLELPQEFLSSFQNIKY